MKKRRNKRIGESDGMCGKDLVNASQELLFALSRNAPAAAAGVCRPTSKPRGSVACSFPRI